MHEVLPQRLVECAWSLKGIFRCTKGKGTQNKRIYGTHTLGALNRSKGQWNWWMQVIHSWRQPRSYHTRTELWYHNTWRRSRQTNISKETNDKKKDQELSISDSEAAIEEMEGSINKLQEEVEALEAGIKAFNKAVSEASEKTRQRTQYTRILSWVTTIQRKSWCGQRTGSTNSTTHNSTSLVQRETLMRLNKFNKLWRSCDCSYTWWHWTGVRFVQISAQALGCRGSRGLFLGTSQL